MNGNEDIVRQIYFSSILKTSIEVFYYIHVCFYSYTTVYIYIYIYIYILYIYIYIYTYIHYNITVPCLMAIYIFYIIM